MRISSFVFAFLFLSVARSATSQLVESYYLEDEILDTYQEFLSGSVSEPVDLNSASERDLLSLPWLSEYDVKAIVKYRQKNGLFRRATDIRNVKELSPEIAESILPYVTVNIQKAPYFIRFRSRSRITGITPNNPTLRSGVIYTKHSINLGSKCRLSILTKKPSGEKRFDDFLTAYAETRNLLWIDQIVVGDFKPVYGQNLIFSHSPRSSRIQRLGKSLKDLTVGYDLTTERWAFRGIFLRKSIGNFDVSAFYSKTGSDTLSDDRVSQDLSNDITYGDTQDKTTTRESEKTIGSHISFGLSETSNMGITFSSLSFDPPFSNSDMVRKRFAFVGSKQNLLGFDWALKLSALNLFGEVASDQKGNKAAVFGLVIDYDNLRISTTFRNYSAKFHSFNGRAFSALWGENNNEIGAFYSFTWRLKKTMEVYAYSDWYRKPWRDYSHPAPISGSNSGARLIYHPWDMFRISLTGISRMNQKYSETNHGFVNRKRRGIQYQTSWLTSNITITGNGEVWLDRSESYDKTNSLYVDFRIKSSSSSAVSGRITLFDTKSSSVGMYELEDGLPAEFPISVWQDRGKRWYLVVKQQVGSVTFSIRYSKIVKVIEKLPTRNELSIQTDIDL